MLIRDGGWIMIENIIRMGDKVDISRPTKKKDNYQVQYYVSQVLELNKDNTATLAMPIMNRHIVPLEVGGKFDMCFYTKSGLYQCQTVILNRSKLGNIYVMGVEFLTDLEKIQRRQYYRLDCMVDLCYRKLSQDEFILRNKIWTGSYEDKEEKQEILKQLGEIEQDFLTGTTSNISGGGIKFLSSERFEKEDVLEINLELDDGINSKKVQTFARVVACMTVFNRANAFETRLEFTQIDRATKEIVVRFVFNEERRRRKRGGDK